MGATKLTTVERVDMPRVTRDQAIRFGIGCAASVCEDAAWRDWAARWLDGTDRSAGAARVAAEYYAASSAAYHAAYAAFRGASADRAAAWTAARDAAYHVAKAAYHVAKAAYHATRDTVNLDLPALAQWAMSDSVGWPESCRRTPHA